AAHDLALVRVVDRRQFELFALDVLPHVEFGPVRDREHAQVFAYVHDAAALPPLDAFACGTAESPEQSATVFVRVDSLTGGAPLTLSGPGIETTQSFTPAGLPARFWQERAALAPLFPCGIDFYFVCGAQLVGLPRTTCVEVN
ncbi:phosphonate C-P lyase system protein PhnH, partial [Paraburkholderia sp. Ac-20340]|nr:phosphonate C-P lyase system protein PhnH [Paraburkholderia sp. Ac-20340]